MKQQLNRIDGYSSKAPTHWEPILGCFNFSFMPQWTPWISEKELMTFKLYEDESLSITLRKWWVYRILYPSPPSTIQFQSMIYFSSARIKAESTMREKNYFNNSMPTNIDRVHMVFLLYFPMNFPSFSNPQTKAFSLSENFP